MSEDNNCKDVCKTRYYMYVRNNKRMRVLAHPEPPLFINVPSKSSACALAAFLFTICKCSAIIVIFGPYLRRSKPVIRHRDLVYLILLPATWYIADISRKNLKN